MYRLDENTQKSLILIDPYVTNTELTEIFNTSINTIIRFRKEAGLPERVNGRPKRKGSIFEDVEIPQNIQQTIDKLKKNYKRVNMRKCKKKGNEQ